MYRVMIIDDEQSARNLLKVAVDFKSLSMEVVCEAASGIEAINIIDDYRPDIVFVDISMPFMSGIEFTEIVTKRYPGLVVIILTALDDFEYARKCIRLPVFDYMVKPIVRKDIYECLSRVKTMLDQRTVTEKEESFSSSQDSSTENIKKYISDHYDDSSLNLTSVAQEFGFSSSYLSRKFKQETGFNFVEYLTMCRMNEAMKIAASGQKMFNTAQAVGIPDPNYFGKCFKKYTGKSYSEYQAAI